MSLVRLLYRSDSELTGSDHAVREAALVIAEASAASNARVGVTGALMFIGGAFVQVLEGEGPAVECVFERICRDTRHRRVALHDFSPIEERLFAARDMVAFEGDQAARALFPVVDDVATFSHRNRLSADTAVTLMRGLLAKRAARGRRPGQTNRWMTATDVLS